MQVVRSTGRELAGDAAGHVVVIDVLRAFTTTAFLFSGGAEEVVIVDSPEDAFAYRERDPSVLLVGEVGGKPIPGFDYGNSPEAIDGAPVAGRTVVLRSSNGARCVVAAAGATRILLGSLSVVRATVRHLLDERAALVTIVEAGSSSGKDGAEDTACADLIEARLRGRDIDGSEIVSRVRRSGGGQAALDPERPWVTPGDLERACQIDRFGFAMVVERRGADLVARALATTPIDAAP